LKLESEPKFLQAGAGASQKSTGSATLFIGARHQPTCAVHAFIGLINLILTLPNQTTSCETVYLIDKQDFSAICEERVSAVSIGVCGPTIK
jgi:hypothetical protein